MEPKPIQQKVLSKWIDEQRIKQISELLDSDRLIKVIALPNGTNLFFLRK